jgi:hypothetical protein
MLKPLIDFRQEIATLARQGVTRISVPDLGLFIGEEVSDGVRRAMSLVEYAKTLNVELFIRNEYGDDMRALSVDEVKART